MSDIDKAVYPAEAAVNRLVRDKEAERLALGQRLGRLVWRNIDANSGQLMRPASIGFTPDGIEEDIANTAEYRVSKRISAHLAFVVPSEYESLHETPDWLLLTQRLDLQLHIHDVDLPEGMGTGLPDPVREALVRISLADESQHDANTEDRRREPYVARSENDTPLDVQDTETVIGILTLIADKSG